MEEQPPATDSSTADGNASLRVLGRLHGSLVHRRRVEVLAQKLAQRLEPGRLLDVGCGDGKIASLVTQAVPGLDAIGAEYAPRPECAISCVSFDGRTLPFPDKSFDGCMFVDVLHHALDPRALLSDAVRVSRRFLLIKDHLAETQVDHWTLRLMDWVGNRPHGVILPYSYLSIRQWNQLFDNLGLRLAVFDKEIPLYPKPLSLVFGRELHFIGLLKLPDAE